MRGGLTRLALAGAAALLAAATTVGCGPDNTPALPTSAPQPRANQVVGFGGSGTNGVERQSARDVIAAASTALAESRSVHLTTTSLDGGDSLKVEMWFEDDNVAAALRSGDQSLDMVVTGGTLYMRASHDYLTQVEGLGEAAAKAQAGRWVRDPEPPDAFSLTSYADGLGDGAADLDTVSRADTGGVKVVLVTGSQGSQAVVANTGPPLPLRLNKPAVGRSTTFSEYGASFGIEAPRGPFFVPHR
jgi:hypothetical protein